MITLSLPAPPSTNNLFANAKGRGRVKTAEYRTWLQSAGLLINFQTAKTRVRAVPSPVHVEVRLGKVNPARDADNFLKAVNDLLVHAGVISGDNLTHLHRVTAQKAFDDVKDGWIEVTISHIAGSEAAA